MFCLAGTFYAMSPRNLNGRNWYYFQNLINFDVFLNGNMNDIILLVLGIFNNFAERWNS